MSTDESYYMYILVNNELSMGKGKVAGQVGGPRILLAPRFRANPSGSSGSGVSDKRWHGGHTTALV